MAAKQTLTNRILLNCLFCIMINHNWYDVDNDDDDDDEKDDGEKEEEENDDEF